MSAGGQAARSKLPATSGGLSPDEFWFRYFRTADPEPAPRDVVRAVENLHLKGKHDQVIGLINGALANDQSQPWMYDILALSMKLARRPEHEIERALLSRIDFTATDVDSLLYSAAFLTRLDAKSQSLRLYRQASEMEPTRPEPYVLGLKLAKDLKDVDAIEWAAAGVLQNVWVRDFRDRHQEAEDLASDAINELTRAGKQDRANALQKAIVDARRRDVMIRLEWSGDGDLDLEVHEPFRSVCSIQNLQTVSGGVFIHDGYGPRRENCYEEYVCVRAPSGPFEVHINYVDAGNIVGKRCQLVMTLHQGSRNEKVFRQSVRLEGADGGPAAIVKFSLQEGRRTIPAGLPRPMPKPVGALRVPRQEMLARARRLAGGVAPADLNQFQPGGGAVGAGFAQVAAPNPGFRMPAGAFTAGVGFQPVIGFVSEGVSLTAAAVVSADRRFVRLSVAPFFNTLREIQTFSFQGGGNQGAPGQGGAGQ